LNDDAQTASLMYQSSRKIEAVVTPSFVTALEVWFDADVAM
jgi:hypothetical protein